MDVLQMQRLKSRCTKLGLTYADRADMLEKGYPDPPDLMLLTPFIFKNREINWIDSYKAYGCRYIHNEVRKRIDKIVTRYSSGLLIYMEGFSQNINQSKDRGVLLGSDFLLDKDDIIVQENKGLPTLPKDDVDKNEENEELDNNFAPKDGDIKPPTSEPEQ